MDAHELDDVVARRVAAGAPYLEFITVPDLSVGLYVLAPGQEDRQQPRDEREKELRWYHDNFNTPDDLAIWPPELDGGVSNP